MKKSELLVVQSCQTPSNPMGYSPPGPSVYGILPGRILEWLPFPSPKTEKKEIITNS